MRDGFVSKDQAKALQANSDAQFEKLSESKKKQALSIKAEVDATFNEMNQDLNDQIDIEARMRVASGLHHRHAEEVIAVLRNLPVGKIKQMHGKLWVLTPFNTVVEAQVYLDLIQNRFLELTSAPVEEELNKLKTYIRAFTQLGFLDLIRLAFKRLLKRN